MRIADVIEYLEGIAPPSIQESYDNSGLIVGNRNRNVEGILVSLDCIESTIDEAKERSCNLVVAHHPIVFTGIKRLNGQSYVERTLEKAIKNDIAIYAIHTNLDNVLLHGVNSRIAEKIGLQNGRILRPLKNNLLKLVSYVPIEHSEKVLNALFQAGAGRIGHYDECSFSLEGTGTFRGNELSSPHVGEQGSRHHEKENRIEVILRKHQRRAVMKALISHHPYEEVAYELYSIENSDPEMGSGWIGDLAKPQTASEFLNHLKSSMDLQLIKFTFLKQTIKTVAVCGGSGSFLLADAKAEGADAFVSSDFKYHQFFDAEDQILICDIGHYESEKFTIDLLCDLLSKKMTTFAVLKTEGDTNPVKYFH